MTRKTTQNNKQRKKMLQQKKKEKRVILIVKVDYFIGVMDHLNWLAENVFPKKKYPERNLVLYGDVYQLRLIFGDYSCPWELFGAADGNEWQDLYEKLLNGGFFRPNTSLYREFAEYFDFGLFLNVRPDGKAGLGYGREECSSERCVLRALFLAAQANVLFGDWGHPSEMRQNWSDEHLRAWYYRLPYMTNNDCRRIYGLKELDYLPYASLPFLAILNHYFPCPHRAISQEAKTLPEPIMEMIERGCRGQLFDEKERNRAWWVAWWTMYFAIDGVTLSHHRWKRFRTLHVVGVFRYIDGRIWIGSSTWRELVGDVLAFFKCSVRYTFFTLTLWSVLASLVVPDIHISIVYELFRLFVVGPLLLLAWYVGELLMYKTNGVEVNRIPTVEREKEYRTLIDKVLRVQLPFVVVWPFLYWSDFPAVFWYIIQIAGSDFILDKRGLDLVSVLVIWPLFIYTKWQDSEHLQFPRTPVLAYALLYALGKRPYLMRYIGFIDDILKNPGFERWFEFLPFSYHLSFLFSDARLRIRFVSQVLIGQWIVYSCIALCREYEVMELVSQWIPDDVALFNDLRSKELFHSFVTYWSSNS